MEILFCIIAAWYLVTRPVVDGIHAIKGTTPPRVEKARLKFAAAVPTDEPARYGARDYLRDLWHDAWEDAREATIVRRDRKREERRRREAGEPEPTVLRPRVRPETAPSDPDDEWWGGLFDDEVPDAPDLETTPEPGPTPGPGPEPGPAPPPADPPLRPGPPPPPPPPQSGPSPWISSPPPPPPSSDEGTPQGPVRAYAERTDITEPAALPAGTTQADDNVVDAEVVPDPSEPDTPLAGVINIDPYLTRNKENQMTAPTNTTTSAETTNIQAFREYLTALASHVNDQILPQLELSKSLLTGRDLDEDTLNDMTSLYEKFSQAASHARATLAAHDARHGLLEEAVNATASPAQTGYYQHR